MRILFGLALLALIVAISPLSSPLQSQTAREEIGISAEMLADFLEIDATYVPVELTPADPTSRGTRAINAASDTCSDSAENLPPFSQNGVNYVSGDGTIVTGFSNEPIDPDLSSCIIGGNGASTGYRTAWYRFQAPATGRMIVKTVFSDTYVELYDTVAAIYQGNSCTTIAQLACNDDTNGLLSQAETTVIQGEIYYIEVADRNLAVDGEAVLNLEVFIESEDFSSSNPDWFTQAADRSRHMAVVVGDEIYVMGGQTVVKGEGPTRTGRVDKFNVVTGEWTSLAPIPSDCVSDGKGYSNIEASYVQYSDGTNTFDRIFIPGGYVGGDGVYSNVQCIYDIPTNTWLTASNAWVTAGSVPAAFAATAERDDFGYYVVGGLIGRWIDNPNTDNGTEVWRYLARNDAWAKIADLPNGRYAHTAELLNGTDLCVVDGLRTGTDTSGNVELKLLQNDMICLNIFATSSGWTAKSGPNIPRFNAASAVGPDGKMYVWGGVTLENGTLIEAKEIEVYDFATDTWTQLDDRYALTQPSRAWARGGFVGNDLWVIGGETDFGLSSSQNYQAAVTGIVERVTIELPPTVTIPTGLDEALFLPLILNQYGNSNGLWPQSRLLSFNTSIDSNFDDTRKVFDVYRIEMDTTATIKLQLTHVPAPDNYSMYLYSNDKRLVAESVNIGTLDEEIIETLDQGQYFVIVVAEDNVATVTGDYRIIFSAP